MFTFLAATKTTEAPSMLSQILGNPITLIILMFIIIYFFMIRPQKKQQKKAEELRNNLQVGDKVVTISGVYGTVKDLNLGESYLTIEVSKGICIRVERTSVNPEASKDTADKK